MAERQAILARIREALHAPAKPDSAESAHLPVLNPLRRDPRLWLPPVGPDRADWLTQFFQVSAELKTDVLRVESKDQIGPVLLGLAVEEGWTRVSTHSGPLTDRAVEALALPTLRTDNGYAPADLEHCSVGITGCDALIAQTGSILVTSHSAGGRALSILPPHHVVLTTMDQLVPDLPSAYELLHERYSGRWPSMISLITGPSRTGDIERVIVLGAHGPKRLTVIIIGPP